MQQKKIKILGSGKANHWVPSATSSTFFELPLLWKIKFDVGEKADCSLEEECEK